MTPEESIKVLRNASEALSHASYCAIVGMCPNEKMIQDAWKPLRDLIQALSPEFTFEEVEPNPSLMICAYKEAE